MGAACQAKDRKFLCFDHEQRTWVITKQSDGPRDYQIRCCEAIPGGRAITLPSMCSGWCAKLEFGKKTKEVPDPTKKVQELFTSQKLLLQVHRPSLQLPDGCLWRAGRRKIGERS